ncbi:hypothetical protein [Nannocystis exedens]|nr:hypothetical protein [Nannocystis exedens]
MMQASLILQALGSAIGIALMLLLDFTAQRDPGDQRAEQLAAAWTFFVAVYIHLVMRRGHVAGAAGFVAGAFGCALAVALYDQHQLVTPPQAFLPLVCVSLLFSAVGHDFGRKRGGSE